MSVGTFASLCENSMVIGVLVRWIRPTGNVVSSVRSVFGVFVLSKYKVKVSSPPLATPRSVDGVLCKLSRRSPLVLGRLLDLVVQRLALVVHTSQAISISTTI